MYVDPQKARQERERLERERQAKIQAEKERKARLKAEEERKAKAERDRKARIKAEEERKAKLKAEQKDPNKKADPKPEAKKPTQPKTEGKKPQAEKKPDDKSQTEITWSKTGQTNPIYGSSAPIYSQGSVPIATGSTPDTKPKVPLNRPPRTWTGETAEETKPEAKSEHKPYKPRDFSSAKAKIAEGRALKEQKKQEQLKSTLKQEPGVSEILKQPSFLNGALTFGSGLFNPNLGETFVGGSKGLTQSEQPNQPETKKESKPSGGGGFWNGALNFGTNLAGDIVNIGKTVLDTGVTGISAIAKTIPQPLLNATNPALFASTVLTGAGAISANATQPPKEDGGWFGKAMNFGNTLVSGAKSVGQSALDMGSNAYNGAANWVSDHKAEIAIGVGIVALGAATVLTGGAALAVAGAVAGGAAVSAGTVATVVAGGVVAGAGLNLAQQGAQIKDGIVDPTTGQKKTDINFGDVAKSGAIGGVMAPVATVGFGLAPVAVGGLGLYGGGQSVKSGVENLQQGNNWSAAFDFGNAGMAFVPMATKGGRNAMFGKEAVARTGQTVNTIADKGGQALNGTKAWFGNQPPSQPTFAMAGGGGGQGSRLTPSSLAPIESQPLAMQGVPKGTMPAGTAPKVGTTPKESMPILSTPETAPRVIKTEPDVGLSNRGYRPKPGERTMTKAEYKTQSSAERNFPGQQHEMNCAPQSCQQVIRASNGRNLSEVEMATSAKTSANYDSQKGTPANKVPEIMKAEGVKATSMPNKPENIQTALAEGKGVVSSHDAGKLWGNNAQGGHAVHVTGVKRGPDGKITHYVINDTGTGQVGRQVPAAQYEGSLLKAPATVTEKPISYGGSTAKAQRRADVKAAKAEAEQAGTTPKAETTPVPRSETTGSKTTEAQPTQETATLGTKQKKAKTDGESEPEGAAPKSSATNANESAAPQQGNGQDSAKRTTPLPSEKQTGRAIVDQESANVNASKVKGSSQKPGYKHSEDDAASLIMDEFHSGAINPKKTQVTSAAFDPKTGKWSTGANSGVPHEPTPEVKSWISKTQNKVKNNEVSPEDWHPGNCAEPNALNNLIKDSTPGIDGKVVYTFEFRKVKLTPESPREWRIFYKKPCNYCNTLPGEGAHLPQMNQGYQND